MKIGLISDTHNYLDPAVLQLFHGVRHIVHGGDIGAPSILASLRQIAPVTAVRGNTDDPGLGYELTAAVEIAGAMFVVHHIVNPVSLPEGLRKTIQQSKPKFVVFGHTHKPFNQEVNGIHFLNPGYAGKTRFHMPRTVAMLDVSHSGFKFDLIPL